jgi:hypothetical protein
LLEMLTELGGSHTSVWGGEWLEPRPHLDDGAAGRLGADVRWDSSLSGYVIDHVVCGDVWDTGRCGR